MTGKPNCSNASEQRNSLFNKGVNIQNASVQIFLLFLSDKFKAS